MQLPEMKPARHSPSPVRSGEGEIRALTQLAVPVALTQLGMMSMGLVDLWMVGRLGKEALGGVALGDLWVWGTTCLGMGILQGLDPIVSQAHGAGDGPRAGRALQRGCVLALVLGTVNWGILLLSEPVWLALDQDPVHAGISARYCSVQGWSLPFFLLFTALRQYLQGRGLMRPALWTILIANVFNVAANEVLIFGGLGIEPMGVEGAGIATASSRVVMFAVLLGWTLGFRLHEGAWSPLRRENLHRRGFAEILRFGVPVGFHVGAEVWAFQTASIFAGQLPDGNLQAHTITLKIASTSFMIPLGIGAAATTRVGNLIGEGRLKRAKRAAWTAIGLGVLVMAASGLLFVTMRHELGRIFTDDPELLALTSAVLPIAAAFQVFDGIQVTAAGALRGAGRTMITGLAVILAFYLVGLPTGRWLSGELGLPGLWWGLCLGLAVISLVLCVDLWRARFTTIPLPPESEAGTGSAEPEAAEGLPRDPPAQ
ncbi:MAG: MATE family efflux transporter [Planctomycetota bacterium]